MAVVPSLSPNCHKPFSLNSFNTTFNSQPKFITIRNPSSSFFSVSIKTNPQRRGNFPILNSLEQESNPKTAQDSEVNNVGVKAALSMLRFYKREISPLLPNSCRYVPTCSEYSMQAYKKYGFAKGTILTAWRLCRCNPLGGSGFDPPRWFDEQTPPEQ